METPLPEVHPTGDLCLDIIGPVYTQNLCEDDMGKGKDPLGVSGPPENPPPFHSHYGREAAPYCARGRGVPDSQLCG